jgi:TolB-like protein
MKKLLALTLLLSAAFALYAQTSYYDGDGGRGKRLAILVPEGRNLSADEAYLTTLVQSVFVTDLSKYSAMSVLDRQNLEKVLKETESGIYKNEEDYLQLGEVANVGYALTGAITKTTSGFALQMQIVDTAKETNRRTSAAYSGSCTVQELDNFTGIRKASLDLLTQMGVQLTPKGRDELLGTGTQQSINAETALAKGITAQRNGTTVQAFAYYQQAVNYDASLAEAAGRLNVLTASISSGNIGQNVRNDIQRRNEWIKLINETKKYFVDNPPPMAEFVYDPTLRQGKTNYQNSTVALSFKARFNVAPNFFQSVQIIKVIREGFEKANRKEWGIDFGVPGEWKTREGSGLVGFIFGRTYKFKAELLDEKGNAIAQFNSECEGTVTFGSPGGVYGNPAGRIINCTFTVKADDITDIMTIRIVEVSELETSSRGSSYSGEARQLRKGLDIIPINTGTIR